ncbi:hypothetical protein ACWC0C_39395 [Streptomyces sp. NPDC001709]
MITQRVKCTLLATTMGLALAAGGVATASTAQAATGHTKISCSAANIRKAPSKAATVLGVGYRGDKVAYDRMVTNERRWWTHGTVTRKSDGKKVRGYVVYECANPYGRWPAPRPF